MQPVQCAAAVGVSSSSVSSSSKRTSFYGTSLYRRVPAPARRGRGGVVLAALNDLSADVARALSLLDQSRSNGGISTASPSSHASAPSTSAVDADVAKALQYLTQDTAAPGPSSTQDDLQKALSILKAGGAGAIASAATSSSHAVDWRCDDTDKDSDVAKALSYIQQTPVAAAVGPSTYSENEVNEALEYLQRQERFPQNYYSALKMNLGQIFANTNVIIPPALSSRDFYVDFSTLASSRAPPLVIEDALRVEGIRIYRKTLRDRTLFEIRQMYGTKDLVEIENKRWWLTHCQALRDGDKANKVFTIDGVREEYSGLTVLFNEYRDELLYFTKDSLYDSQHGIDAVPTGLSGAWEGRTQGNAYESSWWAMLSNARVRMTWPRVTFSEEDVSFDWVCFDVCTHEMTAFGDVVWLRCGDKGACYKKYEHLYFLRDVYKPFFDNYFGDNASTNGTTTTTTAPSGGNGTTTYGTSGQASATATPTRTSNVAVPSNVERMLNAATSADDFANFFTEDADLTFGNNMTVTGKDSIRRFGLDFYTLVGNSRLWHDFVEVFTQGDTIITIIDGVYSRPDGSTAVIPSVDIFRTAGDKFKSYKVYADIIPGLDLFRRDLTHRTPSSGRGQRAANQVNVFQEALNVLDSGNLFQMSSAFSDNVKSRSGNAAPGVGLNALIAGNASRLVKGVSSVRTNLLQVWEFDGTVIGELQATYTRTDGQQLVLPIVSVAKFNGSQITEFYEYVDATPLEVFAYE
eukprot:jgi/Chlat1/3203/Chrsp22S03490